MNKIKKISTVLVLIVTITASFMPIISNAAEKKVTIYGSERYGDLLKRNGLDLVCIPLSYKENGQEHPVYCLNLQKDGATEKFSYDVNLDSEITDMELWRTVVNGYPYKTPEELGCKTKEEAYLATRHAIYCAIYQRDPESYYSHGTEASDRTLNAMKNIVKIARTGTETKQSSRLTINSNDKIWAIDKVNSNYVSKEFSVTALAAMPEYSVNLTGNLVEEIKITDVNNKEQNTFKNGEKFKILIPIKNLNQDGNFEINVIGKVATKPVIVGNPDNTKLQNVAITGSIYEDGQGSRKEYYFSKLLLILGLSTFLILFNNYGAYLLNLIINGKAFSTPLLEFTKLTIIQLPLLYGIISLLVCLAFVFKKVSLFNSISIPLIVVIQIIMISVTNLFKLNITWINDYEIQTALIKLVDSPTNTYIISCIILGVAYCAIFNIIGYYSFKKAEIK